MYSQSKTYFTDELEIFQIIRTLSGSSRHRSYNHFSDYPHCQETFHIIQTYFWSSRHFSDHPDQLDTFLIVWTLRIWSRYFADHLDFLKTIRRFFLSSDYSLDHLDLFWMIKIISKYSRHQAGQPAKPFQICQKFPVSITDTLTTFLWLWKAREFLISS